MSKETALAAMTGNVTNQEPTPELPDDKPKELQSDRFASLARKEAEIVKKQQETKAEREAFEAEREKFKPLAEQFQKYKVARDEGKTIEALQMLGFTEEDILSYLETKEKPEQTIEEKARLAAKEEIESTLKARDEEAAKKAKEEAATKDAQVIASFRADMTKLVKAEPDKFEFCAFHGEAAEELAYEYVKAVAIESNYKDFVTAQEALEMTEAYYEEQAEKVRHLKKWQFKPKDEDGNEMATPKDATKKEPERTRTITAGDPTAPPPAPVITRTRTLTNAATASAGSLRKNMNESREEKRTRLMEMIRQSGLRK